MHDREIQHRLRNIRESLDAYPHAGGWSSQDMQFLLDLFDTAASQRDMLTDRVRKMLHTMTGE